MGSSRRAVGRGTARSAAAGAEFQRLVGEAKDRHNLSDIVAPYTTLRRRGGREMSGLCPFHTEKTPSFEVNDSKGTYYCHGCGTGGDALSFLQTKAGLTFRQAIEALSGDAFPTVTEEDRAKRKAADAKAAALRVGDAREVWASGGPAVGTLAEVYARARGITMPLPPTIRFARTWRWRDHETGEQGPDLPAMLCALHDIRCNIAGIQRIFLQPDGRDRERHRKAKLSLGVLVGSALRLGPAATDSVILCEGPEDGLTLAQELPGRTVWVACGTALMPKLDYPASVRRVVLAGDNNDAGRRAVTEATEAIEAAGMAVSLIFPRAGFKDFNDQLRGIRI